MFENITKFFKKFNKKQEKSVTNSRDAAKERLHLVLMQDRANVSVDFLELMKQEIIEVIKKYIEVDENSIDVRMTNKENEDGTSGAPALYANIPILNIKEEAKEVEKTLKKEEVKKEETVNEKSSEVEQEVETKEEVKCEEESKESEETISENEEIAEKKDLEESEKEENIQENERINITDIKKIAEAEAKKEKKEKQEEEKVKSEK